MLRECNENEMFEVQNNISFLKFIKNNFNKIKEIYPSGKLDIYKYIDDFEFTVLQKSCHSDNKLIDMFLRCNIESIEPIYDEFYFNNFTTKYNNYSTKHPTLTDEVYLLVDYEDFENETMRESGCSIYETVLWSKELDKFFDLHFDNEDKMDIINKTFSKLRNAFCAKNSYSFAGNCFCIIKISEYCNTDFIADAYKNYAKYLVCFLTLADPEKIAYPVESLYYAQELKDMFDYIESEVAQYERNNN